MNVVVEFEHLLEEYYPGTMAIAVNSGTSALFACLKAIKMGSIDTVITTPFTFQATADAIVLAGGRPRFADIHEENCLINAESVRNTIDATTRAIVPVNLFGQIYDSYLPMVTKHLPIIEDSCQAFLHPDNFSFFGDAQCFSFHRSKNLQCGEGGAIVIKKNGRLDCEKIWSICNNGRLPGKPRHEFYNIGFNFRMSEHLALILYNQLKHHPTSIQAELGSYNTKDGYYSKLVYQQPSYQWLYPKPRCPIAEKIAKKVENDLIS